MPRPRYFICNVQGDVNTEGLDVYPHVVVLTLTAALCRKLSQCRDLFTGSQSLSPFQLSGLEFRSQGTAVFTDDETAEELAPSPTQDDWQEVNDPTVFAHLAGLQDCDRLGCFYTEVQESGVLWSCKDDEIGGEYETAVVPWSLIEAIKESDYKFYAAQIAGDFGQLILVNQDEDKHQVGLQQLQALIDTADTYCLGYVSAVSEEHAIAQIMTGHWIFTQKA